MSLSYIVNYSTTASGPWVNAETVTTTSATISSLSANTNYYVQIITVDSLTGLKSTVVGGPIETT